jgi:hypothetical protein
MKTYLNCVLFFVIFLFFASCKDEMVFKHETFTNPNFCADEENCLQVKLDVLQADEENPLKDSINFHIFNMVKIGLDLSDGAEPLKNYVDLINQYEKYYKAFAQELKVADSLATVMNWEANSLVKLNYQTEFILNFSIEHYGFTGGAHGYGASNSLIIDAVTGRKLDYKYLFTNLDMIKRLGEQKLREKYEIGQGKSLNANGFFFENDKFVLPQNIFFNKDGIVLHYNQYEIAAYAFGPIDIALSNQDIGKYLVTKQFDQKSK